MFFNYAGSREKFRMELYDLFIRIKATLTRRFPLCFFEPFSPAFPPAWHTGNLDQTGWNGWIPSRDKVENAQYWGGMPRRKLMHQEGSSYLFTKKIQNLRAKALSFADFHVFYTVTSNTDAQVLKSKQPSNLLWYMLGGV